MNYNLDNDQIIETVEIEKNKFTYKQKKYSFSKKIGVFVLSSILCGTIAAGSFAGTSYLLKQNSSLTNTTAPVTLSVPHNNTTSSNYMNTASSNSTGIKTVSDIATKCMPSIVAITNKSVSTIRTFYGNMPAESKSCGSGVIIGKTDTELLIVTNYHVIEESDTLTIIFSYDEANETPNVIEAYAKGYDEERDLAVIAISTDNISDDVLNKIDIATIGNSNNLNLGEQVVAIGNALGYGQSVTTGIVSALNRQISENSNHDKSGNESIQTDAAINPGNSGGALFNMNGELIGINSAKIAADEVEGMGYAIPISDVFDQIQKMMNETPRTTVIDEENRGSLGISGTDITSNIAATYHMPEGIYVNSVTKETAAEQAGLVQSDIITKFDGKSVSSMSNLHNLLQYYKAGEKVTLTIEKIENSEYTTKEINITLDSYQNTLF